jgi:hypothetical protein
MTDVTCERPDDLLVELPVDALKAALAKLEAGPE